MTGPSITVRPAEQADLDRIEALLCANDLPTQDVQAKLGSFFVAESETAVIGGGGVERYGSNGLLRSVVVTESHRSQGYGTALIDTLEDRARTNGMETLYLLTTTATPFFRAQGYDGIPRERAPSEIRQTTEFTHLCPASATCMKKSL